MEFNNRLGVKGLRTESILVLPCKPFHNLLEKQPQDLELMMVSAERRKGKKERDQGDDRMAMREPGGAGGEEN